MESRKVRRVVNWVRLTLITVYLLILIGGIVRATGSGMGCPDWPKCFGLWVPPTEVNEITYHEQGFYPKGRMVIKNDTLWVSQLNQSGQHSFVRENWKKYPKHDYAVFNVWQTWVEYINRLFGALTGLFVFITMLLGFSIFKSNPSFLLLSVLLFLLTGFQGWLGALVVDYHLAPVRITVHMIAALAMVAVLVLMQNSIKLENKTIASGIRPALISILLLLLLQVFLGTQVRQEVDVWMKAMVDIPGDWSDRLSSIFDFHRATAAALFFLSVFIFYKASRLRGQTAARNLMILVLMEGISGMILSGLSLPNFFQPVHLTLSALLFGTAFRMVLMNDQKAGLSN